MRTTIIAALLLASTGALACTSPATGTLEDIMRQATWTDEAGTIGTHSKATIHVALPALALHGFSCLTWNVEIVLPPVFRMDSDHNGEFAPTAAVGLASDAHHVFLVDMPGRDNNTSVEVVRGWLRVKIRNPLDSPGVFLSTKDGSPLWLYPIRFQVSGN